MDAFGRVIYFHWIMHWDLSFYLFLPKAEKEKKRKKARERENARARARAKTRIRRTKRERDIDTQTQKCTKTSVKYRSILFIHTILNY